MVVTLPPSVAGTDICAQTAAMGAGRWGSEEADLAIGRTGGGAPEEVAAPTWASERR